MDNRFESLFGDFVVDFGGEILRPDSKGRCADYLFRRHNVVAELKSLMVDGTESTRRKLGEIIEQWCSTHQHAALSAQPRDQVLLHCVRNGGEEVTIGFGEIREKLAKVLLGPIEGIMKDANRQIRETKERLNIQSARGVILIFNESNPFHGCPEHFAALASQAIQKPNSKGERQFPHLRGMVYFSLTVTTHDVQTGKDMPFWMPAQVAGEGVEEIKQFQDDLKQGWCRYIEKTAGIPVIRHFREMRWNGKIPPGT